MTKLLARLKRMGLALLVAITMPIWIPILLSILIIVAWSMDDEELQ